MPVGQDEHPEGRPFGTVADQIDLTHCFRSQGLLNSCRDKCRLPPGPIVPTSRSIYHTCPRQAVSERQFLLLKLASTVSLRSARQAPPAADPFDCVARLINPVYSHPIPSPLPTAPTSPSGSRSDTRICYLWYGLGTAIASSSNLFFLYRKAPWRHVEPPLAADTAEFCGRQVDTLDENVTIRQLVLNTARKLMFRHEFGRAGSHPARGPRTTVGPCRLAAAGSWLPA